MSLGIPWGPLGGWEEIDDQKVNALAKKHLGLAGEGLSGVLTVRVAR